MALRHFEPQQYRDALRHMILSRKLDDREIVLKRQNHFFFQVSGAGHEAIQVAAGILLGSVGTPSERWTLPW